MSTDSPSYSSAMPLVGFLGSWNLACAPHQLTNLHSDFGRYPRQHLGQDGALAKEGRAWPSQQVHKVKSCKVGNFQKETGPSPGTMACGRQLLEFANSALQAREYRMDQVINPHALLDMAAANTISCSLVLGEAGL